MKRNILFCAIAFMFMSSVLLFQAGVYNIETVTVAKKSDLEQRILGQMPDFHLKDFLSGNFQDYFEAYISDSFPNRNRAIMTNALIQRKTIEIANCIFGFDSYPTYFDSYITYSPKFGILFPTPSKRGTGKYSESNIDLCSDFFHAIAAAGKDVSWYYLLPDRATITDCSPVMDLVTNPADREYCAEMLKRILPKECKLIDLSYSDTSEYGKYFFKTDHHYQIQGAIDAYNAICQEIGIAPVDFGEIYTAYDGEFYGSSARSGKIDEIADVVQDVRYQSSNLSVTVDGKTKPMKDIDKSFSNDSDSYSKSTRYENVYAAWFHHDYGLIVYENPEAPAEDALLLIGDSFDNSLAKFFAENYRYVYELDHRHYQDGKSIIAFLEEHENLKNAVFVLSLEAMPEVLENCNDILD